jgi:putative sterol carrier protein
MSLAELTERVRAAAARHPDFSHRVKLDLGETGVILWDGIADPPAVSNANGPAEATIGMTPDTLSGILDGTLDPGDAWFDGLFAVEGSTAAALALGQLFVD